MAMPPWRGVILCALPETDPQNLSKETPRGRHWFKSSSRRDRYPSNLARMSSHCHPPVQRDLRVIEFYTDPGIRPIDNIIFDEREQLVITMPR
jgi:hypothetical protein